MESVRRAGELFSKIVKLTTHFVFPRSGIFYRINEFLSLL